MPGVTYSGRQKHRNPIEPPQSKKLKANQEITAPRVRLVAPDGKHEVMTLADALQAARDAELDLVQVAGDRSI